MSDIFKIESGIPFLDPVMPKYRKYPFGQMNVGDSFLVSDAPRASVAASMSRYGHRSGTKFSIRKVEGGFRVWRTA